MDDSGTWGKGGVFSALARLSKFILEAYKAAYSAGDLHMGDVHLVRVPGMLFHSNQSSLVLSSTYLWCLLRKSSPSAPRLLHTLFLCLCL